MSTEISGLKNKYKRNKGKNLKNWRYDWGNGDIAERKIILNLKTNKQTKKKTKSMA